MAQEKKASDIQKERIAEIEKNADLLLKETHVMTLSSINEKGYPRTCCLSKAGDNGFREIYFITSKRSHLNGKATHFESNPKDYTITIEYKKNPNRTITGSYDKNGLPDDFADFAETVFDFIRFYGLGEILDPSVYGKAKRRKSEYIFCSVTFDEGYKSYYYLTDDDSIEIGDFVLVPAGKDNHEAVVEVVNIEYFDEENVPLPIEKTKRIIRKCTDEDFDLSESE